LKPRNIIVLISLLLFATDSSFSQTISKTTHTLYLGEEKVWVDIYEKPGADITLLNLHDNENTSVEAGLAFIKKHGGRLIDLRHGRGREVVVRLNGVLHRFDPNRMFSDVGLRASMEYFNNNSDEVFDIASAFRDSVVKLAAFNEGMVLISIHNNSQNKMTIKDFRPGEWYGEDTKKTSINPRQDPDNFFFVTHTKLFNSLSSLGYNVAILANNPPDRGMLMDYCVDHGMINVSVEAEHGKQTDQIEMLEALWTILNESEKELSLNEK